MPIARPLRTLAVSVAALAGTALGGPSADALSINFGNKIDMGKLRSAIEANARQAYQGFPVGKAVCPKSRAMKKGDVFDCTIPVSDGVLTIAVTQTDGDGNVRFVARQAVLDLTKARTFVATQIEDQTGVEAEVDCGRGKVRMIAPGKVLNCTATDGTDTLKVKLLVKDTSGNVSMSTE